MKRLTYLVVVVMAGCASSGVIQTGKDTYTLSKTSGGGMFTTGAAVKADLLGEANRFCAERKRVLEVTDSREENAIPFVRMPNAEIKFRCIEG
jgi:hypothetical protein